MSVLLFVWSSCLIWFLYFGEGLFKVIKLIELEIDGFYFLYLFGFFVFLVLIEDLKLGILSKCFEWMFWKFVEWYDFFFVIL